MFAHPDDEFVQTKLCRDCGFFFCLERSPVFLDFFQTNLCLDCGLMSV